MTNKERVVASVFFVALIVMVFQAVTIHKQYTKITALRFDNMVLLDDNQFMESQMETAGDMDLDTTTFEKVCGQEI